MLYTGKMSGRNGAILDESMKTTMEKWLNYRN